MVIVLIIIQWRINHNLYITRTGHSNKMIKMVKQELIDWQCKCGAVYALEKLVPTVLHGKHPDRARCTKQVSKNKECGQPFPDQATRNKLYNQQFGIVEPQEEE